MTELIPDPEQFLRADPLALEDPLALTAAEMDEVEQIQRSAGAVTVAAGLAAAFLIYRKVASRQIKAGVTKMGPDTGPDPLWMLASAVWTAFVPRWVSMTVPYLIVGYREGVKAAQAGDVPAEYLDKIARGYAEELGHHINDVSLEALMSGYQAQVNRKVPPLMAARRTADAYGVTRRGMNTLVNVWTTEDAKKFTDQVLPSAKDARAKALTDNQLKLRARQVGDNEEWATRTQAKQIVWMYGQGKGVIPSTVRRVWITADDERVCKVCGPMDGKSAKVGEKFVLPDKSKAWTPPTHVNCRCDVVLDLAPAEDIADQVSEWLASDQMVSKARGGDRYDRDKAGRFARTESRPARSAQYKERTREVDEMLNQVNQQLLHLPELTKEPTTGLTKPKLTTLSRLSKPELLKPTLAGSPQESTKQLARRLADPRLDKGKLSITLRGHLVDPPITGEVVDTKEGKWLPLDIPIVAIMEDWGGVWHEVDYDNDSYVVIDADQRWYEVNPNDSMPDRYERTLNGAIGQYWQRFMDRQSNGFSEGDYIVIGDDDMTYEVNDDAFQAALHETVNNIPTKLSEMVKVYGVGERADEYIEMSAAEIAGQIGLVDEVEVSTPHLIVAKHGLPGVTENVAGDIWRNPGKWKLTGSAKNEPGLSHYNFEIHYAEPNDLLD